MDLTKKKCVPCEAGTPPLSADAVAELAPKIPAWKVVDNKKLSHEFKFKNFKEALAFTNKVGELAEKLQHHPDIYLASLSSPLALSLEGSEAEGSAFLHARTREGNSRFLVAALLGMTRFVFSQLPISPTGRICVTHGEVPQGPRPLGGRGTPSNSNRDVCRLAAMALC